MNARPNKTPLTLRFAINLGNPVLTCRREDGSPGGITVELAQRISSALDLECELITYPTAGKVVDDAQKDRWDVAFLAVDPLRAEIIRFTDPYITIQGTVLVPEKSRWRTTTEMDEAGVVINVGKGAAYDLYLSRTLEHATLERYASSQDAIVEFLAGHGDMVAGIRQPLEKVASENPRVRVLPDNFGSIHQAVCVLPESEALFRAISSLLAGWISDGSIENLVQEYAGNE